MTRKMDTEPFVSEFGFGSLLTSSGRTRASIGALATTAALTEPPELARFVMARLMEPGVLEGLMTFDPDQPGDLHLFMNETFRTWKEDTGTSHDSGGS